MAEIGIEAGGRGVDVDAAMVSSARSAATPDIPPGMAVCGIGIDAVEVDRFRTVISRTPRFVERVFADIERAQCLERGDAAERFAARFAAKEAMMKAMSTGLWTVGLNELVTVVDEDGAPHVELSGRAAARASSLGFDRVLVSLSHTEHVAVAVAIGVRDTDFVVRPDGA